MPALAGRRRGGGATDATKIPALAGRGLLVVYASTKMPALTGRGLGGLSNGFRPARAGIFVESVAPPPRFRPVRAGILSNTASA